MKTTIKDYYGRIIAYVDTDNQGNKVMTNYYGKILGRYNKSNNSVTDYNGKVIVYGEDSIGVLLNIK